MVLDQERIQVSSEPLYLISRKGEDMKKIIFVVLCMFAVTTAQVFAMDLNFDRDTGIVTISGVAEENENLAVIITDSEVSNLGNVTERLMENHSIGFYEVNADENGEYSLSFKTDFGGVCNVFVEGAETSDSGRITLYSASTLCNNFNAMINKVQVKELVEVMQELYGGDEEVYEKYFDLKKTDLIDKIIYKEKPYESLDDVYEVFAEAVEDYEPPKSGSGGGGGGGISLPAIKPPQAEEPPQANIPTQEPAKQTFTDVAPGFWGYEAIEELYKAGIVNGVSNEEFAPDESIKREEFVKMLVALTGLDVNGAVDTFTDTDKNAWYSPYLAVAQDCGLAYGKEDGSFGVGEVLTRQDMAVLATRALGTTERGITTEFADVDEIADYAKNSVEILCGLKVMNGVGDGNFAPKATATRAQAAKVIYEIAKLIK